MKSNKTERLTIRFSAEELANIRIIAENEELKMSAMIRQILAERIGGTTNENIRRG